MMGFEAGTATWSSKTVILCMSAIVSKVLALTWATLGHVPNLCVLRCMGLHVSKVSLTLMISFAIAMTTFVIAIEMPRFAMF
jgi:hypothetical protein